MIELGIKTQSLLSSDIDVKKLIHRAKELGMNGFAFANEGCLSDMYDIADIAKAEDFKIGYGVELAVDFGMGIPLKVNLYAKNNLGLSGLIKVTTFANRNMTAQDDFPVIKIGELNNLFGKAGRYHNCVIATTAGIDGAICGVYNINDAIKNRIASIKNLQCKTTAPFVSAQKLMDIKSNCKKISEMVQKATEERDSLVALSKMTFSKREKAIAKLPKNSSEYESELKKLNDDKEKKEWALKELPGAKTKVALLSKQLKAVQEEVSTLTESIDAWFSYEKQIEELNNTKKTEQELIAIAESNVSKLHSIFGPNLLVELQYHRTDKEMKSFGFAVGVANKLNIPFVAANNVHIVDNSESERLRRQTLKCIKADTYVEEDEEDEEMYLKSESEMYEILSEVFDPGIVEKAIKNTEVVFQALNATIVREKHYPKFISGTSKTSEEIFDEAIKKGIEWRFPNGMDEEHRERLDYEISVIKSMGYVDYHLIVKDFLEYARLCGFVPADKLDEAPLTIEELLEYIKKNHWINPGFTTGPGRGSAVGSLTCYLFGITHIDPILYNLLFERFLNPERVSMPDIDSDIANGVREKTIAYVRRKYGENAVCLIMTKQYGAPRGVIRLAARFYGQKKNGVKLTSLGDIIAKSVPSDVGTSFSTTVTTSGEVVKNKDDVPFGTLIEWMKWKYQSDNDALAILDWASKIEGLYIASGEHAAGVVISDNDDVSDYIPLKYNTSSNQFDCQCNMVQVEENGLLKMDFLGLLTLNIITDTIRNIEKTTGVIINPLELDFTDKEVYKKIFTLGITNAVFQFESNGMKSMLKRFKPDCFEDLIILVSMFRPGPIQYLDDVIAVKNGTKKMHFLCDELRPILGKTYGAIVYQEQVMEIFQSLAGYTLGGADMVRRYMSKKKKDKLAHERQAFVYGDASRNIKGCVANGISADVADELFSQMEEFAKYAFNKSHATAYAFNAYVTAWLKYYYPVEFFCAALNWASDSKKIAGLMVEAKKCGVSVKAPNINFSEKDFTIKDGEILFGLGAIKSVKNNADAIISERKNGLFFSLRDFCIRTEASPSTTEKLIDAGAFDIFNDNRAAMSTNLDDIKKCIKKIKEKESLATSLRLLIENYDSLSSDEDVVKIQSEHNHFVSITKWYKKEAYEKSLAKTNEILSVQNEFLNSLFDVSFVEDKVLRLQKEKDLLGIYVTEHPVDNYTTPAGVQSIDEATPKTNKIFGVIENVKLLKRRADGAEFASFTVSDTTGEIQCTIFVDDYEKFKASIVENTVHVFNGMTKLEKIGIDDNGNIVTSTNFIVKSISEAKKMEIPFVLSVSSYARFHINEEQAFINACSVGANHELYIYDETLDEMRLANFLVSEKALELGAKIY